MRLTSRIVLAGGALAAMALCVFDAPAIAQSLRLKVEIPFAFQAGEKTLPAGTYFVERQGDAIHISDGIGHASFSLANSVVNKAVKRGDELVFNRYGETNFLAEVRWVGYANARRLMTSPAERKLASAPEQVIRAATTR